jgi:hypothetical protein
MSAPKAAASRRPPPEGEKKYLGRPDLSFFGARVVEKPGRFIDRLESAHS